MANSQHQADFDKVWNHFVVEKNPPSVEEDDITCLYRGPNGSRCAVGVLLPDEVYQPTLEGVSLKDLDPNVCVASEFAAWIRSHGLTFLGQLQQAHDQAVLSQMAHNMAGHSVLTPGRFHEEIERLLREVAADFGCEIPE